MPEIKADFLDFLRCPQTGQALQVDAGVLYSKDGSRRYEISDSGIPVFAGDARSQDALTQQKHYDNIAKNYIENQGYPHTRIYNEYLNRALIKTAGNAVFDHVAELCCGRGEAFFLFGEKIRRGVGVDISLNMLESARRELNNDQFLLVQGDAVHSPLADRRFDSVFMLGGIHHVNDRLALFKEVNRVLKPGGRFYWREPVSDFFLWRLLRALIYRLSPALDEKTERPLLFAETAPVLEQAGLELKEWKTVGFFGYCLFMNSDVLLFNKLFRFLPGIEALTRLAVAVDDWTLHMPGLSRSGLFVIGMAQKPV